MSELPKGVTLMLGDCLRILQGQPSRSVQACVTSPPYFGLRDYGVEPNDWPSIDFSPMAGLPQIHIPEARCCLGLERDPWAFIGHLVQIFREVRRVLRDDGTLWLNLGDTYVNHSAPGGGDPTIMKRNVGASQYRPNPVDFIAPKNLLGIPWRAALALQADGWYLRQDIIWHKPNPMPESVKDRCTKAHEYIFLLSKSPKYYFDGEAIQEEATKGASGSEFHTGKTGQHQFGRSSTKSRSGNLARKSGAARGCPLGSGSNVCGSVPWEGDTRNKRSVWPVTTKPFKGSHFATFPPDLIEPCVLAGCPEGGTVLDPFGGSGTTAGVAIAHGRKALICEINSDYAGLMPQRINQVINDVRGHRVAPQLDDRTIDMFGATKETPSGRPQELFVG